LEMVIGV